MRRGAYAEPFDGHFTIVACRPDLPLCLKFLGQTQGVRSAENALRRAQIVGAVDFVPFEIVTTSRCEL